MQPFLLFRAIHVDEIFITKEKWNWDYSTAFLDRAEIRG